MSCALLQRKNHNRRTQNEILSHDTQNYSTKSV